MRCPNCRKKMLKGYLQSSREITWSQKALTITKTEDVVVAEKKTFGSKKEAYYWSYSKWYSFLLLIISSINSPLTKNLILKLNKI